MKYKLLKDLPGTNAGEIIDSEHLNLLPKNWLISKEFFSPIEEELSPMGTLCWIIESPELTQEEWREHIEYLLGRIINKIEKN